MVVLAAILLVGGAYAYFVLHEFNATDIPDTICADYKMQREELGKRILAANHCNVDADCTAGSYGTLVNKSDNPRYTFWKQWFLDKKYFNGCHMPISVIQSRSSNAQIKCINAKCVWQ